MDDDIYIGVDIGSLIPDIAISIETARKSSPIAAKNVTLLAASKTQPLHIIEKAINAGISCFGENKVQEAEAKWSEIKKKHPNISLHLIGGLQTNKVKQALALFDTIQTLDRLELAQEIVKARDSGINVEDKNFYIQVNTGREPQKSGIFPEKADELIYMCREMGIKVVGLMCVPPVDQPPAPHFALLREIAIRNGLTELSMGMSEDFEVAIRMGSSCVRLGTAIFGKRQ